MAYQLLPLRIPPGIYRNGTEYQAKGRWYDCNLIRWVQDAMKAIGGWVGFGNGYQTLENLALRSYQLGTSPWSVGAGNITVSEGQVNHFDLEEETLEASELSDPGSTAAAYVTQTVGTLTGSPETLSVVVEKISGATVTDIEIYDATAAGDVIRVRLTWATGAVAVDASTNGTSDSAVVRKMGAGPYGGDMYRIIATVTPDNSGNSRELRIYPTGNATAEAAVLKIHHVQLLEDDEPGDIIFTTTASVEQNSNRLHIDSPISGMIAWRDNSGVDRLAVAGTCQAWAYADGVVEEITPSSFTCGKSKALPQSGLYGAGAYGIGLYGAGDPSLEQLAEAQSWQFDTWGEYLVAMATSDGKLYEWQLTGDLAAITNAPTGNSGLVVTGERFLFALGAGGDGRTIQWCDQEDNTVWTPASTNQAGDFILPGSGELLTGRRGRRETLLWTTVDMFSAQFVGGTLVYSFRAVGNNCGPISRRAVAMIGGGRALWMGHQNFYVYDGVVNPLPSEVNDYVFSDMNRQQRSQIAATTIAETGEVYWFYPSSGASFNDRYVAYNVIDKLWTIGQVNRTAGIDRGVFNRPMMADRFGVVYEHERGTTFEDFLGAPLTPYAESGPVEIASGERIMQVRRILPDALTLGDVLITLKARNHPLASDHSEIQYTPANPTSVRIAGRQISVRIDENSAGWRFGTPRLDIVARGSR